jgi:molecular chaperone HtpG
MKKEEWDEEKKEQVVTDEDETVNQANALWARAEVGDHRRAVQGVLQARRPRLRGPAGLDPRPRRGQAGIHAAALHPAARPFDLWDRNARHGIKLYVRRVFIMDDAEQLMPLYLRFVRGVVDSADLPLNVSREILQEEQGHRDDPRRLHVKKVLACSKTWPTAKPPRRKSTPSSGASSARCSRKASARTSPTRTIAKLLRFASTHADTPDETVSLADYIGRMKEGQEKIYYVTAETFNAAKNSPHLEIFRKKGIEVLLLSDRVDEWVTGT